MRSDIFLILFFLNFRFFAQTIQTPIPYNINTSPTLISSGVYSYTANVINVGNTTNPFYKMENSAQVTFKAADYIHYTPNAIAENFTNGFMHAYIDPNQLGIASFHPQGFKNIPKYSRFEIGIKLPDVIQKQVDDFLTLGNGVNPYNPDVLKLKCTFKSNTNVVYERFGYYYRDYTTQGNLWVEQTTDYKFRVRFAPPEVGDYLCKVELYFNGNLTNYSSDFNLNVSQSLNKGHLKVANGNTLKLSYENGDKFFAIGQNIAYAIEEQGLNPNFPNLPIGAMSSPNTHNTHRGYISDLHANGGNFARIRLDAWSVPVEAKDKSLNNPLSLLNSINNYNHNQMFMWEMDKTLDLCESNGVYIMLNILQDQIFSIQNAYGGEAWGQNPYSALLGPSINDLHKFFDVSSIDPNAQLAQDKYRKLLYYIHARWGYSTNIAMWEMINETENTGQIVKETSPGANDAVYYYIQNPTFRTDLASWTCDMKFYMEYNFYPDHITTTGTIDKTGMPFNGYINCLNVYSSNDYSVFSENGTFSNRDDNRHEAGTNYFNQGRPFIYGELGVADQINWIEKKNDRNFHNTIWATIMSGNIGTGLNWQDWPQPFVNHRYNFQAVRYFMDQVDFSKVLTPDRVSYYPNASGSQNKSEGTGMWNYQKIFNYYMKDFDKEYIIGWSMSGASYWANDSPPTFFDVNNSLDATVNPQTSTSNYDYLRIKSGLTSILDYDIGTNKDEAKIEIRGLKTNERYHVDMYSTYNGGYYIGGFHEKTKYNSTTLYIPQQFLNHNTIPLSNNRYPDYAYIIKYDPVLNLRTTNPDTVDIDEIDTLCFNGDFVPNYRQSKFTWDFGNGYTSNDTFPCTYYKSAGEYIVTLNVTNTKNDSVKYFSKKLIITNTNKVFEANGQEIKIYPNPASQIININYNDDVFKSNILELYDGSGRLILSEENKNKLNVNNIESGLYLLKFRYNNYEKSFKINIQH